MRRLSRVTESLRVDPRFVHLMKYGGCDAALAFDDVYPLKDNWKDFSWAEDHRAVSGAQDRHRKSSDVKTTGAGSFYT
jgi:hypothetical protein